MFTHSEEMISHENKLALWIALEMSFDLLFISVYRLKEIGKALPEPIRVGKIREPTEKRNNGAV